MSSAIFYTRDELRVASGLPIKGELCHQCGVRVPQFEDMDDELHQRIIRLVGQQQKILAMREFEVSLDCPRTFAKIWVAHRGKANPEYPGPPCPYCGGLLRTSRARQCPHCFRSWHGQDCPELETDVFSNVRDAVAAVKAHDGRPEDFRLFISDNLQDVIGMNMAIIGDAILERGWEMNGYHQMEGYRIYRYKYPD